MRDAFKIHKNAKNNQTKSLENKSNELAKDTAPKSRQRLVNVRLQETSINRINDEQNYFV